MRKLLVAALLILPLTTTAYSLPANYSGDVVIGVMGQSNMVGRATYTTGATFPAGVQQYNQNGVFESVTGDTMLNFNDGDASSLTLSVDFAVKFKNDFPNANLIFVPTGLGGTGFITNYWNKGDVLYASSTNRINAVLSEKPSAKFIGILWHQGENDAKTTGGPAAYEANLDQFIMDIRHDITGAATSTPFVNGGFSNDFIGVDADRISVNATIEDTPNRVLNSATAEANDLSDLPDNLHFNESSTRLLGQRYYDAWLTLISTSTPQQKMLPTNVIFSNVIIQ